MSKRTTSVAGTFYPLSAQEIRGYIGGFNEGKDEHESKLKARAIISPHAGYVFSGACANEAYRRIDVSKIKRVIVIGPSHRIYLKGASVALYDSYESPCEDLEIDLEYSNQLIHNYEFLNFNSLAHSEHSTETQVPFIEYYCNEVKLVEIVYGDMDYMDLVPIIQKALSEEENLVVISTDLSHFHELSVANRHDAVCKTAIEKMSVDEVDHGCEACGMIGVKALLEVGNNIGLKSQIMDYRTSYDTNSDASRVVGYLSVIMEEK